MKHLKYLSYVIRHKWFVFIEACKLGIPWRGFVHDFSKFSPIEWFPYAATFYGKPRPSWESVETIDECDCYSDSKEYLEKQFNTAWLHHQHCNPHHWQWWILKEDNKTRLERWVIQSHDYDNIIAYDYKPVAFIEVDGKTRSDDCDQMARFMLNILNTSNALDNFKVLPMPDKYRKEMLADWIGAGKAQGKPDTLKWYEENKNKIILHPDTREWIEDRLARMYNSK